MKTQKQTQVFLFLVINLFASQIFAQAVISGNVTDQKGEILIGANIYLEGTYDGTSSDSNGDFQFETTESGEHTLRVDYIGYNSFTQAVNLNGSSISLNIKLRESINELNAVTITAGTFEAGDKKKSITISSLDMVTTAGSSGDVYGALQSLPGTITVGESGKLFVKGGDSRESKTFIDGTLVYVPYSSSVPNNAVRGRFNPFMFSGTMFSTGGYSAEYGQALSSVLVLKTNEMPVEDQLNISLLSVGADIGATKTWEKSSVSFTSTYYNLKPYMSTVPQNRSWAKEPTSVSSDLSYRLKTKFDGLFKLYATVNRSDLSINQEIVDNPGFQSKYDLLNKNKFFNSSWTGEIANNWILSTGFSYTDNVDEIDHNNEHIIESLNGSHAKISLSHKMNDFVKIKSGIEHYYKKYGLGFSSISDISNQSFENHNISSFVEGEIYASTKFVTRIGARFENSDYLQKSSFAPRLSTAYKINKQSQVSFSFGQFYQDPENDFMLNSNSLQFEKAEHYTLSYIYNFNKRVLRTEVYYKNYKDLVKFSDQYLSNNGYGEAIGLDLFWRDNETIKNAEYWISYSYIDTKRNYLDYPEYAIPSYSSKHNLTFVYKHWFGSLRSLVGGTIRYSSPRVYNNPNSNIFNGEEMPAYKSIDLNWSFLYRENVILYFSASNVLGFENEFGKQYASSPDSDGIYNSQTILPEAKRFFVAACFITLSRKGNVNQMDKIN